MSEKTFNNIRQTQLTDTADNWSQKDKFVPKKGELVVIQEDNSTSSQLKIGNGKNTLSQLSPISGGGGAGGTVVEVTQKLSSGTEIGSVSVNGASTKLFAPTPITDVATQSKNGLMSANDKKKLDGVAENANNYALPAATSGALGGIKSGGDITVDNNGVVSVKDDSHNHTGLMSTNEKKKLDEIPEAIKNGNGTGAIVINNANAKGKYSIAGGATDKSIISDLIGSINSLFVTVDPPVANGALSLAFGGSTNTYATGTIAVGVGSSAGCMGYYFTSINGNELTLSTTQSEITAPSSIAWDVGDVISVVNDRPYPLCAKITAISGNIITLDKLPFTSKAQVLLVKPNDFSVYVAAKPHAGAVQLGYGAIAIGYDSTAAGPLSTVFGYENTALDTASFVTGRENIGAWGALVGGYQNEVLGDTASATGRNNIVSGSNATANGASNKAIGRNSHAEGLYTISVGERSHSEGYSSNQLKTIPITAEEAITIFETTKFSMALGAQSHVEGRDTLALKDGSHSEGRETISNGLQAHAEGYRSQALANTSHSEGSGTKATGVGSHSEGISTEAKGRGSHAEGINTIAAGEGQHVSGKYNRENDSALFIIGDGNNEENRRNVLWVNRKGLQVQGLSDTDKNYSAEYINNTIELAETDENVGSESAISRTIIMPNYLETTSCGPTSLYTGTILSGRSLKFYEETDSYDEDGQDIILQDSSELTRSDVDKLHSLPIEFVGRPGEGENAEVFNGSSKALGARSHAEGGSTIAYGNFSHTEGQQTIAGEEGANPAEIGIGAHAEGMFTQARGARSHAEGNRTVAYGAQGHTEGTKTTALGSYSHVEGQSSYPALGSPRAADNNPALFALDADNDTIHEVWKTQKFSLAKGDASHVEGINNLALGGKSHVEGSNNIASADYQHVEGRFNAKDDSAVHIVGWGNSESNRKNIHTIDKSGNAYFSGSINASKYLINGKQFNTDWNINDESQIGYIKNRTHYTISDASIQGEYYNDVIDSSTTEITFSTYYKDEIEIRLKIGRSYKLVIDDQVYPVVLNQYTNPELDTEDRYYNYVQLTSLDKPLPYDLIIIQGTTVTGFEPDWPFDISFNTNLVDSFNLILCDEYEPAQVKHLEEKYIPKMIARKADIQKYIEEQIGNIENSLDAILAIQNQLIGGGD